MLLCRKINFGLAIIYWIAQVSGALVGAFICYMVLGKVGSPGAKDEEIHWLLSDVCGETLGTFTFITFILIQAHPDTTFTPDAQPLTTYCLVALALYISRGYTTHSGGTQHLNHKGCINPGMAVSLSAFHSYITGVGQMNHLWIWVLGPFAGAAMASIFYEGIFKKLHSRL
jgi:aquaporin PIP